MQAVGQGHCCSSYLALCVCRKVRGVKRSCCGEDLTASVLDLVRRCQMHENLLTIFRNLFQTCTRFDEKTLRRVFAIFDYFLLKMLMESRSSRHVDSQNTTKPQLVGCHKPLSSLHNPIWHQFQVAPSIHGAMGAPGALMDIVILLLAPRRKYLVWTFCLQHIVGCHSILSKNRA